MKVPSLLMVRRSRRLRLRLQVQQGLLRLLACLLSVLLCGGASSMTVMLRVAVQPDLPPYQFIDSRGRVVGAHIDILNNIAKRYNMQVEYVPMPSYTACFEALESEQVDVVLGAHPGIRHNVSVRTTTIISSSQVCLIAPDNRARGLRTSAQVTITPLSRTVWVLLSEKLPQSARQGCA